jgi:hypothetical protein
MVFTLDMSSHQTVDDVIGAGDGEEIMFFGRALEIMNVDLACQHQLSLPLFLTNETVSRVT